MSVFGHYARLYDAFYAEKDYAAEAAYLDGLLQDHRAGRHLLDLGCGTGRHLEQLAQLGYRGTGVDGSASMLALARERLRRFDGIHLEQGDARIVRLGVRFDAVLACFHVMNYLVEPGDFGRGVATAAAHLAPGGLMVFDSWHGPAVRRQPPEQRIKRARAGDSQVVRHATPQHWPDAQRVDVHYRFEAEGSGELEAYEETHRMRYLFPAEIAAVLSGQGFALRAMYAWLTRRPPTDQDWSVCYVAQLTAGA